jgi:hypothetical protein
MSSEMQARDPEVEERVVVLGAGERLFTAPLTIESISTSAFSGGAVGHVFAAHR